MSIALYDHEPLLTEGDARELGWFLCYVIVGWLAGRAAHRAYDRRRYFVEGAGADGRSLDVIRRLIAS